MRIACFCALLATLANFRPVMQATQRVLARRIVTEWWTWLIEVLTWLMNEANKMLA